MKVLYEDNHVLCVDKPANIPVNSDETGDTDMMSLCRTYIKEKYNKPGNVWLGLVHRLDRPVGGCMVFARTSKAASRLSESIRTRKVSKEYVAVLDGIPAKKEDVLEDYLVKNSRTNMVSVTDAAHGKFCRLSYRILDTDGKHALVLIQLDTGRPHQIRVQFASRHLPLVCDQRYNPHARKGQIALWAVRLSFPHPTQNKLITVTDLPPQPWHGFEVKL